jgi:hypothetical protein
MRELMRISCCWPSYSIEKIPDAAPKQTQTGDTVAKKKNTGHSADAKLLG